MKRKNSMYVKSNKFNTFKESGIFIPTYKIKANQKIIVKLVNIA